MPDQGLRDERGQAMVVVAVLMAALIGCAAFSVDVGRALLAQFRMQSATDAAALAGAANLPSDPTAAVDAAQTYAAQNGVGSPTVSVSTDDQEITVTANQTVPTLLARVLGTFGLPVSVVSHARAAVPAGCWGGTCTPSYPGYPTSGSSSTSTSSSTSAPSCPQVFVGGVWSCAPVGGSQFGLAPLYVTAASIQNDFAAGGCAWTVSGCSSVDFNLKNGNGSTGSDRGALALDGPGGSLYQQDLVDGGQTAVQVGGSVTTETGNIEGPTDTGVTELCTEDNNQPYVIVPVVSQAPTEGNTILTVAGFATFLIACPDPGSGQIVGHFLGASLPGSSGTNGSGSGFGMNNRGRLVSN